MAVTPYTKVSSASIAGLVTDGNALMNTEQSNLDEANYEILRDGTRRRRRPIVQETDGAGTFLSSLADSLRSSYVWQTPAFRDNYSILCEEDDGEIRFYTINHTAPSYIRGAEVSSDRLRLELWGNQLDTYNATVAEPCTYSEGNGSLYVFNTRSGTIKIDLLTDDTLRMTAVGTWVRDYRGAAEELEVDYRKPLVGVTTEWNATDPYIDVAETVLITEDLPAARAYNLSNTGWDAKSISEFMIQSGQDYTVRNALEAYANPDPLATVSDVNVTYGDQYVSAYWVVDPPSRWPATTDKYLSGRQIDSKGVDIFSFPQLVQAKDNKNMPPMGARIGPSEFGPAGTLVGIPTDMVDNSTSSKGTSKIQIDVTFNSRQTHYQNHFLEPNDAAFVHSLAFTVQKDGITYQGGASGLYAIQSITNDGLTISFFHDNQYMADYTSFQIVSLYMHPSPEYFPHRLVGNANGFDYKDGGRRPLAGAFFAGRLWQTADNHNRVYFSQALEASTESSSSRGVSLESLCFSAADPTDGDDNALVPSDGGYINTSDSGTHYGLVPLGDSLLLFTDRGVWAIRPGGDGIFSAADYRLVKVVGAEVLGTKSFVSTGDQVYVATDEGILSLQLESTSFGNTSVTVKRLLDNRLRQGYEDILKDWPSPAAAYDPESRTIRWLFKPNSGPEYLTAPLEGVGQPVLSLSMYHNAWYKYVLGADSRVFDTIVLPFSAKTTTYNKFRYLIGGEAIPGSTAGVWKTGWGVEVELGEEGLGEWVQNGLITGELFADYRPLPGQVEFRDSPKAFMLTNHIVPGEGINWSQINYIVVHNRNVTETWRSIGGGEVRASVDGGTLLSVRWDWMNQQSTAKWSDPYQTYKYRRTYIPSGNTEDNTYGEPVLVHKMKLRGRGREFRLYFESDEHKDSHIEGWAYQGYILNGV